MYRDAYCRPRFSFQDFFIWASFLTMPLIFLPTVWTPLNVWTLSSSVPYTLLWNLAAWIPFVLSVYGLFKNSDDEWSSFGEHDLAKCLTLTVLVFLFVWKGLPALFGV